MPNAEKPIKVTRKGQVTLPKEFRDILGVEEGDLLHAHIEDNSIIFSKPGLPQPGQPVGKRAYDLAIEELEEARKNWR